MPPLNSWQRWSARNEPGNINPLSDPEKAASIDPGRPPDHPDAPLSITLAEKGEPMKDPVELTPAELEAIQEAIDKRVTELGLDEVNLIPPPDADRERAAELSRNLTEWILAEPSKIRTENITARLNEIKSITTNRARSLLNDLEARRFDPLRPPPPVRNIVTLQGVTIATQGNITVFAGQSKSGKSNGLAAIIAACLATRPDDCDLLGFRCDNPEGKAVIYLDAEQSKQHFHSLLSNAMKRAGLDPETTAAPPWLHAYNVKGWEPEQINKAVEALIYMAKDAHGGTHLVMIDGYADLVKSPNDETESNELIRRLMTIADEAETSIIGVIHYNAGSPVEKARGHIGSQADRKCEAIVKFEKKDGVITAYTTHARSEPLSEANGSRFEYSTELGRFKSLPRLAEVKADKKTADLKRLAADAFNGNAELSYSDLCKRIKELEAYSETSNSDKKKVSELHKKGFIFKKINQRNDAGSVTIYELGNLD